MQTYYFRVCIANAFVKGERELHFMFHFVILSKTHHFLEGQKYNFASWESSYSVYSSVVVRRSPGSVMRGVM